MKRLLSFTLVLAIMLSCTVVFASAQTTPQDNTSKLSESVQAECLRATDTELIQVYVAIVSTTLNEESVENKVFEECGITKNNIAVDHKEYVDENEAKQAEIDRFNLYTKTKLEVKKKMITQINDEYIDTLSLSPDDIIYRENYSSYFVAKLSKAEIMRIAEKPAVDYIDTDTSFNIRYNIEPDYEGLFKSKYYEQFNSFEGGAGLSYYDEEYYHLDSQLNIDWVFVRIESNMHLPWEVKPYGFFGDRVLTKSYDSTPFNLGYAIYNTELEEFVDIRGSWDNENYEGLREYFEGLDIGIPLGDIDDDGELTIMDATYIQKCLTKIIDWPTKDLLGGEFALSPAYLSDFDRDGNRTVMDATKIQQHLAAIN